MALAGGFWTPHVGNKLYYTLHAGYKHTASKHISPVSIDLLGPDFFLIDFKVKPYRI